MSDLADTLRNIYAAAPTGKRLVALYYFGIQHAAALRSLDRKALIERAGLTPSMLTELNKAINLSDYVEIRRPLM